MTVVTDEQRDLDNLLKHPGWLVLTNYGRQEIESRLNAALANAANSTDDALALNLVRQCVAVKQAIEAFMSWPASRLKVLQQAAAQREPVSQLSRRGDL